jgi:YD repeat-containing protein
VLTSTDAREKVGTFKYDDLNRPLTITWTGGETITYTYDTGTDGIGHLTKMVDPAGTTSFTYNQLGRMLTKTQATGAVTLAVAYAYDAFGRLSSLKYPSGKVITYSYDTSGEHQTDLTNPFARTMFDNLGLLTSQPLQSVRTGTRVRNDLSEKHCIMHPYCQPGTGGGVWIVVSVSRPFPLQANWLVMPFTNPSLGFRELIDCVRRDGPPRGILPSSSYLQRHDISSNHSSDGPASLYWA